MAVIDVSQQRASLLSDATTLDLLPPELLLMIQDHQSTKFLDAIASAALVSTATDRIFTHFESVFADICARWILSSPKLDTRVLAAFARILPFAPSLSVFLVSHLRGGSFGGVNGGNHNNKNNDDDASSELKPLDSLDLASIRPDDLPIVLLALWRLNNFDKRTYAGLSKPSQIQTLFAHENPIVQYLAVRIFCQLHNAADVQIEALLQKHIPKDTSLVAELDGREADYAFLSLHEDSRREDIQSFRSKSQQTSAVDDAIVKSNITNIPEQNLTPLVVKYGKTVLPRPLGPVTAPTTLALTPTTVENLENLTGCLQRPGPILLHGLSGSGKTSLVHEIARELGKQKQLVTLHLNEQTDAKMLLGLYTTDSKPGSFSWRPGVLTTAVKEGRWVLIEDLDRAPTEVMSTLLPLIERGELLIPGRGETIQATEGFRIFATVRTLLGMNDKENLPSLIGLRLWQLTHVKALPQQDLKDVINSRYPLLHKYVPGVLAVFDALLAATSGSTRLSLGRMVFERPLGTRDLLKWCGRLDEILRASGCKTGEEPITDTTRDRMFLEAADVFVGGVKEIQARNILIGVIAKEMHLSPERVEHYLTSYLPDLEDNESRLTIGRVSFAKGRKTSRGAKNKRPFATTTHAKRLLEQIAVAVRHKEPLLLVGETGIGKTTVVQQLAESLGHQLVAVNLSQQSEAGDLLGGFKPVSAQTLAMPIKEEFEDLFERTGVSAEKNKAYLDGINKKFAKGRWREVSKEWRKAPKMFEQILAKFESMQAAKAIEAEVAEENQEQGPAKRRKTESSKLQRLRDLKARWDLFSQSLDQFDRQVAAGPGGFAFAFVEGKIVKAARNGDWVLLDEINLASPDTLESIAGLFQTNPSLLLSETGEIERIQAHPNFRVFGAMNPATDVGKRDLPMGLRSRFTEIYVQSPDRDKKDLLTIIKTYLKGNNSSIDRLSDDIADLYLEIKKRAEAKLLVDQANEVPHFSLRTLTRVLTYTNDVAPFYGLERAVYEGFCMGFTTLLSEESERTVMPLIQQHLLKKASILTNPPKRPIDGKNYVNFKNTNKDHQYWLLQGNETPIERPDYVITPYVERNLLNLVRATSTRRYPILIQGPTSAGKTSMIEYLANYTGNKFVRINNHEHTDLQEYLGTYVSDSNGKLKFQEGILVQAMREGSWIVLDELNLAPTDVLEALNRLLDDNRELLIPETQEIVRPAENFCLFATQNPPGLYGGRKVLSRAFRNRFLELHYDDIPESELETILQKRSRNTAPSDCRRIVQVYKQLTRLRQESRVFEQKNSFATLRDLFRWALRAAETRQDIADHGFMLLAERVRKPEERDEVKKVIEEVFKVKIDPDQLYDRDTAPEFRGTGGNKNNSQGVIWTRAMRRLYVLVKRAIVNNEPVLLVGETGCGKTTVVQLLAEFDKKELHIVNAHQNTETGDLIGSQRPVRNRGAILDGLLRSLEQAAAILGQETGDIDQMQAWYQSLTADDLAKLPEDLKTKIQSDAARSKALFEWSDGSLVHAMREGTYFLLDEISLADDSVLERLNSVLEPARTLLLAEKGITDSFVVGAQGFQFFATMNPGGDFGKRELSPALRNRFTEIWVPAFTDEEDVHDIVVSKLDAKYKKNLKGVKTPISRIIVNFSSWFGKTFRSSSTTALSVRDILAWVQFMNICNFPSVELALLHGAAMVFIDTIGANPSALIAVDPRTMDMQRQECLEKLSELCGSDLAHHYFQEPQLKMDEQALTIGDFSIERLSSADTSSGSEFGVPTTKMNAMRVIRALQGTKPILLEGNPGVGKTTLVTALARACGRPLTRINLSDQTDLMDLFGTDVPVEGAEAGNFCWKNAPFLEAMQNGSWVLLDEMNLASQTVLEGLNACLDHRGEVYISELDQVFKRHPDFKLFAAQNPHSQGGGRKGLPSSFVNRFIVVYSDVFTKQDLLYITAKKFDKIGGETQTKLIEFMSRLDDAVVTARLFGAQGSPWEFNLRDTLRWGDLLTSDNALLSGRKPDDFLDVIIRQRFRTERDRVEVDRLFTEIFQRVPETHSLYHDINSSVSQVGLATLQRNQLSQPTPFSSIDPIHRLKEIESILIAVEQDLPCILVGPSGSGKSALLNHVAAMAGRSLVIFPLNADVDTMDLIGGFEQADPHREVQASLAKMKQALQDQILQALPQPVPVAAVDLMGALMALSGEHQYPDILRMIENLLPEAGELAPLLSETAELLRKPLTLENPRFEWLDGVIVRAVETGAWLVLDNANLCSASVLDRLNSLLERPNGSLSINEHSGPGGEPRILTPHPDFRIFLTVDPRYGELSRAMRNRSVEIYLEGAPWEAKKAGHQTIAPVDGSLQRFHTATRILNGAENADVLAPLAFDVLSLGDTRLLEAFMQASTNGLIKSPAASQRLAQLLSYISAEDAGALRQAVASLYGSAPNKMLMPLHPLLNSPMIQILEQDREGLAAWIAGCYELYLDIQSAQSAMEAQLSKVNVSKPSQLNRLQRSWIADKVASLSRDSTVNAARFLASMLKLFKAYMSETINESRAWKERRAILRRLMLFWTRTFEALIVPNAKFEEARFQAHLTQGSNLLRKALSVLQEADDRKMLATILEYLERDFVVGFKLSTGLSMEALWNQLRPEPVADQECLKQVIEMERLADRFDSLRWKADASIPTLRSVQEAMARAYTVVRSGRGDASALVKELESEISTLEARIGQHPWTHEPFFASTFEALRQALVLHQVTEDGEVVLPALSDIDVLSNLPTVALMRLRASGSSPLQLVDCLLAQDSEVRPWTGTLSRSLLLKYDATSSASMHELHSLETELPIMGKILAKSSDALATDSLKKTERLLLKLMEEVMAAHGDACKGVVVPFFQDLLNEMGDIQVADLASLLEQGTNFAVDTTQWPQHLVVIFERHFYKALRALAAAEKGLQPRSAYTSVAWVQFSLASIKLFVPDKIFDPHHRAEIEQEEHREIYESLQSQIAALETFELAFTGQHAGLRCKLLMEEVAGLGEPPAVQSIYRPGDSELRGLQGEFNNVLNALVQNDVAASHLRSISTEAEDTSEELSLVERNLVALVGRFIGRFNAYQDLTMPLVSFLRCLQLGLSLGQGAVPAKSSDEIDFKSMAKATPFLSGTVWDAEAKSLPLRSLEFLSFVQAIVAVEGIDSLPENLRQAVHESFYAFHEEWSKKLEADRKAEEQKNSLFRFKGSLEDEEAFDQEEFDQLFPDYVDDEEEQDADAPKKKKQIPRGNRDLSILLAEAHEKIFLSPQEPQQSIRILLTQVARRIARAERNAAAGEPEMDALLLPATILAFEDQIKAFSANVDTNNYNFYTDSILVEVRKALTLVTALKKRFQELQTIEEIGHHQTLADVIIACDKVLDMSIDDPLAAIISPMEKLYAHVYEWHEGGWATKAHKATVLYEKLRDTICDWRRLELSSWSRLLDAEAKKCHDDAKSWWFIAYGAVILQPCSWLQEGKDLHAYAVELLGALESYFNTASLGQFTSRLNLLRQLRNQLELLMVDEPQLSVIRDAVQNFITYHARYERKVKEAIAAGRTPLDRKMKDVLLLSKWRDKNIEALRASARKSHQKLFKLVRKFRGVLSQPVSGITEQGLPEEEHKSLVAIVDKVAVQADQEAIALVSQLIPSLESQQQWARITNLPGVLKMMGKFGSLPASAVEIPSNLDEYITSLVTEMAELRKETPQHLTDENKEAVAHLKTRKTKLYTDTLKTLREMGFSRNLGTTILDRQKSAHAVLVHSGLVPHLSESQLNAIEYFYHKMLDLAPKFRQATFEHNDDLDREIVHRSIGFLEGILYVMFKQRMYLSRTAEAERALSQAITFTKEVSGRGGEVAIQSQKSLKNHGRVLRWLVQILKFAVYMVDVHGKLGETSNDQVRSKLQQWLDTFATLATKQESLPRLPTGFSSSALEQLHSDAENELDGLRESLSSLLLERPDMAFVIRQVQLWTSAQTVAIANELQETTIDEFAKSALDLSSRILVALQKFPEAVKNLPHSQEDAGWFLAHSEGLEKAINTLAMPRITSEVDGILRLLKTSDLSQPAVRDAETALLRAILPMLEQYAATCQQNLAQYAELHRSTCRLGYTLSNSFIVIAKQGFCSPQEESKEKSGESGDVQSGTGLGDGEGAEDISKDIKDDEDLSELAQDQNNKNQNDIEDNPDAVDMGEDDLEGDMGSVKAEEEDEENKKDKDGSDDEEDDEMDEEAGGVDDLDPTAVDEKMWDGKDEEDAEKDQKGENNSGKQDEDEQAAAEPGKEKKEQQQESEEAVGEEEEKKEKKEGEEENEDEEEGEPGQEQEGDAQPQEELNNQDQNVQEQDTLALPDDMQIDISDGEDEEEDNLDDLEDGDKPQDGEMEEEQAPNGVEEEQQLEEQKDAEKPEEAEAEETDDLNPMDEDNMDVDMDKEEEQDEDAPQDLDKEEEDKEKEQPGLNDDQAQADDDNAAPSDVKTGGGLAQDDQNDMQDDTADNKAAQREQGAINNQSSDQDNAPGSKGEQSRTEQQEGPNEDQETEASSQPFKKLGDALDRWYRNQRDIRNAPESKEEQQKPDVDMAKVEFQHLQDEDAEPDTQALGTANDEEVRPMDDAMAIDTEMEDANNHVLPEDEPAAEDNKQEDVDMEDAEVPDSTDAPKEDRKDGRSGVATHQGAFEDSDDEDADARKASAKEGDLDEEINEESSTQLSAIHLEDQPPRPLRDFNEALSMWTTFQTKTQSLSMSLSSQLRLILTPSQSTKLSGSFRTGKRLNIKKIIPYIASSYKRDKIWMRRAIPTKRSYQILLCVDDSQSMGDSLNNSGSAGRLALESLVMTSRALTMLEVGQVGVLGFGTDVFVAHRLTDPFASHDAGARVLQQFTFKQEGTDMVNLLRRTIDHFRDARLTSASGSGGGEDLWQLALILSDGLVQSKDHARLRPLLREAMEQRVMVVFIVMDDARDAQGNAKKGSQSVLDLKEARFGSDGMPVIHRYLDSFPFQYYLIVHHLDDLPGALAGLLRSWFSEVSAS
ncbi:midasin [Neurospora intermedia]|uniref:Midasin n=1 Tax=Neurospora intermedia TaxID=5142 RepID=A0ABR3DPI8_NEUIN